MWLAVIAREVAVSVTEKSSQKKPGFPSSIMKLKPTRSWLSSHVWWLHVRWLVMDQTNSSSAISEQWDETKLQNHGWGLPLELTTAPVHAAEGAGAGTAQWRHWKTAKREGQRITPPPSAQPLGLEEARTVPLRSQRRKPFPLLLLFPPTPTLFPCLRQ